MKTADNCIQQKGSCKHLTTKECKDYCNKLKTAIDKILICEGHYK